MLAMTALQPPRYSLSIVTDAIVQKDDVDQTTASQRPFACAARLLQAFANVPDRAVEFAHLGESTLEPSPFHGGFAFRFSYFAVRWGFRRLANGHYAQRCWIDAIATIDLLLNGATMRSQRRIDGVRGIPSIRRWLRIVAPLSKRSIVAIASIQQRCA